MTKSIKINRLTVNGSTVPQRESAATIQPKPLNAKAKAKNSRWKRVLLMVFLAVLLVGGVVATYTIIIPAQKIYNSAQTIRSAANALASDFEGKDLSKMDAYVTTIQDELRTINSEVDKYEFLDDLDATRGYYNNLQVIGQLTEKTDALIVKALPEFKVLLGSLGYEVSLPDAEASTASTTSGKQNADDGEQVQAVISELPRLVELYNELEPDFIDLATTFNQIDAKYVPDVNGYAGKVRNMQKLTSDYPKLSSEIKDLFSTLPNLLGAKKPARYLVVLQNEKELRSSSGIVSAYGVVTIKNGEIVGDIKFEDAWNLENAIYDVAAYYGASLNYYNKYGQNFWMNRNCGSSTMRSQDVGMYPDMYWTMDMFTDYYDLASKYYSSKFPAYDHVVLFNTYFASDLVRLIEPIKVTDEKGRKTTITGNDMAEKMFRVTSSGGSEEGNRKSFIGQVAEIAQKRFKKLDSEILPGLVGTIIHSIQAKHLNFSSKDPKLQKYFDQYDMSGRVTTKFNGDYLHLGEAQYCALKANFFIKNDVVQNISIDKKGNINKSVKVTWRNSTVYNPNKHTNVITTAGTHLYRGWVRFVVPNGSTINSTDGYEKSRYIYYPQVYNDSVFGGRLVSDNAIWYDYRRNTKEDPATSYELNAQYTLPANLNYNKKGEYRLLLEKHPGKDAEKYTINISHNGRKTSEKITLDRDKVVIYKDGAIYVENHDTQLDFLNELVKNAVAI